MVPAEELKRRIKKRTLQRLRGGVIWEMENLKKAGVSDKKLDEVSLYYRWVRPYLRGEINQEKTLELISTKIWQYVKRQMTWFKRDKNIRWISKSSEAEKLVEEFLG
jgi:tRNA dimethylallyltransferase